MRPVIELLFAVLVGFGLEAAMADNYTPAPPLELAAAELGLDGHPAPDETSRTFETAGLDQPESTNGNDAL